VAIVNKRIIKGVTLFGDDDRTKQFSLQLSGVTAGKALILQASHTDDRTITLPDGTGTLALDADKADLNLGNLTSPTAINQDLLPDTTNTKDLGSPTAGLLKYIVLVCALMPI
jgi:hypothetical protein